MVSFISRIICEHFAFGLLIPVYIILLTEQIGLSFVQAGIAVSIATAATFVLEVPAGILADKIGRKHLLLTSSLFHLAAYTTLYFSESISLVLVSAVLTGAGFAFASGTEESYVHDLTQYNKTTTFEKLLSRVSISDEGATIVGMIFCSFLLLHFDYSFLISCAIFSLIGAVVASFFLEEIPNLTNHSTEQIDVRKNHGVLVLIPVFLLLSILSESGRLLWQPQLLSSGWFTMQLGYLFAIMKLGSIGGAYLAGNINIKNVHAILIGTFIGSLGLCIFSIEQMLLNLLGLGMFLFAENFVRIHITSFIFSLPGVSKQKATTLSLFSLVNNTYLSASGVFLGVAASVSLSQSLLLVASIKIFALTVLCIYLLTQKNQPRGSSSSFQIHSR